MTSVVPNSSASSSAIAHAAADVGGIWKVIAASSVGTMIEWYDFYIFGSLAAIIATRQDPVHLDVPSISFRQRLVRRIPSHHRDQPGCTHRKHLRGIGVPDRGRARHRRRRLALSQ